MTRRFSGDFWRGQATRSALMDVVRPTIESDLTVLGRRGQVRWLIDTGSPYTILHPEDALRLLGNELDSLDFDAHPQRHDVSGVGRGPARTIIVPASLTFEDDEDEPETLTMPILIAEPIPPYRAHQGNWRVPSLLGCDVLRYFDLELSLNPPSVTLTEAAPA